jgi:hypothetical protein
MTWIRPPHPSDALKEALRSVRPGMPAEYGGPPAEHLPASVRRDSIVMAHARVPEALAGFFSAYNAMFNPDLGLSRREQELVACVVSKLNDCFY